MMDFMRKTFLGLAAALTLGLSGQVTQAATLVVKDGIYNIGYGDEFAGLVVASGGAGSWTVQFDAIVDPLLAGALATIGPVQLGFFSGLTMSWIAVSDSFVLASTAVTPPNVSLGTNFAFCGVLCGDDTKQWLQFSWDNSTKGAGFDFEVVAPVPVPAAGLLLLAALGGLTALRRRKSV